MAKGEQKAKAQAPPMDVQLIPLHSIEIGAQMLRHDPHDDDIQELAADIAAHGLLQPIGVYPLDAGRFQLLWGSRRLAAHVRLCRTEIPARIVPEQTADEIVGTAVRENLLRRDLTLREEIDAVRRLTKDGLSPAQISDLVGKSRAWVDRRLAFDSLPLSIRDHVLAGDLPIGHAECLALVEDPGAQSYLISHTLQHRPSLVALRASIESIQACPTFGEAVEAGAQAAEQTHAQQAIMMACHVCEQPHPINSLVIIRTCGPCAHAIQHAAAPRSETDAQH